LFYKNNGVLVAQVAPGDWTISLQVNGSGQFCSVAEMIGPVDFDQSLIIGRITDGVANSPSNDSYLRMSPTTLFGILSWRTMRRNL
jgi:hypothetical protein